MNFYFESTPADLPILLLAINLICNVRPGLPNELRLCEFFTNGLWRCLIRQALALRLDPGEKAHFLARAFPSIGLLKPGNNQGCFIA
jgi:hypothetical protein